MSLFTTFLKLVKPEETEKYNISVINDNADIIDSALSKLDQVDNTSDLEKPVSTAQREAINNMYTQANSYTNTKIAQLINGAPETLDTLKEIADAIEENETIVEALDEAIGNKANKTDLNKYLPLTGGRLNNNKEIILELDNTSENATQTSLAFKQDSKTCGLLIVDDDGSIHYWDSINGKTLFWIGKNIKEIYDSASNTRKKILLQGDESGSCANDFILINQQSLSFTDNICIISDNRITANSLADVYFTSDTIDTAKNADIFVETYNGNVKLTATNLPIGDIKATIRIRVV